MTTPLKAYQSLYTLTSKILKFNSQDTPTAKLYFGVLCRNFVTLTLPYGSASLGDADGYSDNGNKNSTFYISEFAKLTTLSQSIFLNEVVVNPSACTFAVSSSQVNHTTHQLTISWFPNPLYQSYKVCIAVNRGISLGIFRSGGTTSEILLSDNSGFSTEVSVGNFTSVDLTAGGYLSSFGSVTSMNMYLFGYTGPNQTGTRSNIPSIMTGIQAVSNYMYFQNTLVLNGDTTTYLYNISNQKPLSEPLGYINGV